ncbi:uncharacterized protein LOC126552783 isoform X1 [Aphis gossypii]|uniref:uncharacterized protein LOC126552783 isoform X1 n=1 Tax=Aphis gossypii TaxID=80765 RepID=UPI0021594BB0|nr:uncharacterized protein LOC126552783 isoform X1 [Aphis gossypii]
MKYRARHSTSIDVIHTLQFWTKLRTFKNDNQHLPQDSFTDLVAWLPEIDINQLRNEYIIFSKSFDDLTSGIDLPTLLHCPESISSSESCEEEEKNITQDEQINMAKIGVSTILYTLSKYDLSAAFLNLYIAYKVLGTIPVRYICICGKIIFQS